MSNLLACPPLSSVKVSGWQSQYLTWQYSSRICLWPSWEIVWKALCSSWNSEHFILCSFVSYRSSWHRMTIPMRWKSPSTTQPSWMNSSLRWASFLCFVLNVHKETQLPLWRHRNLTSLQSGREKLLPSAPAGRGRGQHLAENIPGKSIFSVPSQPY